jgi:hypothetical protein
MLLVTDIRVAVPNNILRVIKQEELIFNAWPYMLVKTAFPWK